LHDERANSGKKHKLLSSMECYRHMQRYCAQLRKGSAQQKRRTTSVPRLLVC
jgi:hypothetical protein